MNLRWKQFLVLLLAAGLFLADAGFGQSGEGSGKINQYRMKKLIPFVKQQCALHLLNGQQIQGKLTRIEPEYLVLIEGSGPFYVGEKRIPIYDIQKINSEKVEHVFFYNRTKNENSSIINLVHFPDIQLEELFAILDAEEKPLLAKSGKEKLPNKPVPQPVKKTMKKNEIEIIDLINAQATNEDE
jgi:hypothetical protein